LHSVDVGSHGLTISAPKTVIQGLLNRTQENRSLQRLALWSQPVAMSRFATCHLWDVGCSCCMDLSVWCLLHQFDISASVRWPLMLQHWWHCCLRGVLTILRWMHDCQQPQHMRLIDQSQQNASCLQHKAPHQNNWSCVSDAHVQTRQICLSWLD